MSTRKPRQRGRTPPSATPVVPVAAPTRRAHPRGAPLTDTVTLTDAAGTCWLAYVEPSPPEASFRRSAAVLPGRRLRFDSLESSVIVSPIPAGSPFLPDERLQLLLSAARPVPADAPRGAAAVLPTRVLRSVDWAGSVAGAAAAIRDAVGRQWQATAAARQACLRGLVHVVAPVVVVLVVVWDAMLIRPRARV